MLAELGTDQHGSLLRGHVQTVFGKINVIMTLRGGGGGGKPVTLTFLFVYCFLFANYYSKILLQLCQLYSTGLFSIEELDPLPDARVW